MQNCVLNKSWQNSFSDTGKTVSFIFNYGRKWRYSTNRVIVDLDIDLHFIFSNY